VAQRDRVVGHEALDVLGVEAGALERELHAREQQRLAVGEHVAHRELVRERILLRAHQADRVVQQQPARLQHREQRAGVIVDLRLPDVLGHADARDRVVGLAGQLAVVGDPDLDAVGDPRLLDQPPRQLGLRRRERDARHADAVVARGVDREAAPAAADVEHALAGLPARASARSVELGPLRLGERLRAAREQRAAVGHRLVQEQREELVADVVVVADRLGVALRAVALAGEQQLGRGPARDPCRQRGDQQRGQQAAAIGAARSAAAPSRRRPGTRRRCRRSPASPRRRRGPARAVRARAGRARSPRRGGRRRSARRPRSPARAHRPRTRSRTGAREARARARGRAERWGETAASPPQPIRHPGCRPRAGGPPAPPAPPHPSASEAL
jgi:hypothetical protein